MLLIHTPARRASKTCWRAKTLLFHWFAAATACVSHNLFPFHFSTAFVMSFTARPSRTYYTSNRTTAAAAAARTEQQQQQQESESMVGTGQMLGITTFGGSSSNSSRNTAVTNHNGAVLSQEEIRARRLAALSGTNHHHHHPSRSMIQRPTDALSSSAANDVIDLCTSSSDDDDDDDDKKKPAAKPPPSRRVPTTIPRPPRRAADFGTRTLPIAFDMTTALEEGDDSDDDDDSIPMAAAASKRQKRNPLSASQQNNTLPQTKQTQAVTTSNNSTYQVCSYNLWFDPVAQPARMQAVADILLQVQQQANNNHLWLMGFQEVTDSLAVQLFPRLERAGYTIVRQPNNIAPYGCAIAVYTRRQHCCCCLDVLDAAFEPYSFSRMGRGILYVRVRCPTSTLQEQILFCTTHLESWGGPHLLGSDERQEQALELEAFCQKQMAQYPKIQTVILTGDWNWDDVRPRSKGPDPVLLDHLRKLAWKDAWSLHPKDPGYTYDGKSNPMLLNQLRRRFDRVLVHSSSNTRILSSSLVGKDAIAGLEWDKPVGNEGRTRKVSVLPSDHYGLVVQLQMEGK